MLLGNACQWTQLLFLPSNQQHKKSFQHFLLQYKPNMVDTVDLKLILTYLIITIIYKYILNVSKNINMQKRNKSCRHLDLVSYDIPEANILTYF